LYGSHQLLSNGVNGCESKCDISTIKKYGERRLSYTILSQILSVLTKFTALKVYLSGLVHILLSSGLMTFMLDYMQCAVLRSNVAEESLMSQAT